MLTVTGAARTDAGRVRPTNQDCVAVVLPDEAEQRREKGVLAIVADGMGGHQGGAVASRIAISRVADDYYATPGAPSQSLLHAFQHANRQIYELSRGNQRLIGMGTTCTAVAVVNDTAFVAHVGDSRAYLIREAAIRRLTEDHSRPEERHILLRAMGTRVWVDADFRGAPVELRDGDRLLLCSDGLYLTLQDAEMAAIAMQGSPETACGELLRVALERGAGDNVSAIVLCACHM